MKSKYSRREALGLGLGASRWGDETTIRPDTAWHHYAIVWSGTTMGLYVDAEFRGQKRGKTLAGGEYYLGAVHSSRGRATNHWKGLVDEFAMFDRVLSPLEIKKLHAWGKQGRPLRR